MENIQTQGYMHFMKGVLEHIVAMMVASSLSYLAATFVLSKFLTGEWQMVYWMLIVTGVSLAGCILLSLAYYFCCKVTMEMKLRLLSYALIFLLTISISTLTVLFSMKSNEAMAKGTSSTTVTIDKVTTVLDMNDGWKDLSEVERQRGDKLSKAVLTMDQRMRKHDEIAVLPHRIGTSSKITPEWESDSIHQILAEETVIDNSKKCSDKIRIAKMVYTDISFEKVDQPFNYLFKITYFNAHNSHKNEWQTFFVDNPIEVMEFKIRFPKSMPFPKAIRLLKSRGCFEPNEIQEVFSKAKSPKDYFEENRTEKEVVWHIENPSVKFAYKIEWDWE
jgi:hypothetical protein